MEGELPDLKKKQEERKKAGLPAGGSGSAARAPFAGATGGSGAAVAAAAKAQPEALRQLAARFGATLGGKLFTTAGLMLLLAASMALLQRVLFGTAQARMGGPPPELGALNSTLRVRRPRRSKALDYLVLSYKHEFTMPDEGVRPVFRKSKTSGLGLPPGPMPQDLAAALNEPEAEGKTDWETVLSQLPGRIKFERGVGSRAAVAGGDGGSSGAFERAEAASGAAKPGAILPAPPSRPGLTPNGAEAPGQVDGLRTPLAEHGAAGRNVRITANRAMGQLKGARAVSGLALNSGEEGARTLTANAFEGEVNEGGKAPASPVDMNAPPPENAAVQPLGDGAPAPEAGHANATEYQAALEKALGFGAQAGDMKKQSLLMIIAASNMMALGALLLASPKMRSFAMSLISSGAMMLGMSSMLGMQAGKLAEQAKVIGDSIDRHYGQQAQGRQVQECMDQALQSGTRPEDCKPNTEAPEFKSAAKEAAQAEMGATYSIDGGGGGDATPQQAPASSPPASR